MAGVFSRGRAQRGFQAAAQEVERKQKAFEAKKGRLFRFYLKDGEVDVPFRFLTADPILFYEHSIMENGRTVEYTCTQDEDCEHCAAGVKATYKGAWLGVDGREFERDEWKDNKKTGKKELVKDRLKLYVRGQTDIAKLDHKHRKFGLTNYPWFVTKTGRNQSTSYELERGEKDKLTNKQILNLLSQLPEKYRNLIDKDDLEESLYLIVEAQIFGFPEDEEDTGSSNSSYSNNDDEEDDEDVNDGVMSIDDEDDEEEKPVRKMFKKPGVKSGAKPGLKKPAPAASKPKAGLKKPIRRK